MSKRQRWGGRRVQQARAYMAQRLPAPCARGCGAIVTETDEWVLGHVKSRAAYPELMWDQSNWQIECAPCSEESAADALREAGMRAAMQALGLDGDQGALFPADDVAREAPELPLSLPRARAKLDTTAAAAAPVATFEIRDELRWNPDRMRAYPWLARFADVPADANPPLAMTPPHPEAVGSYGDGLIEWYRKERGITLRWWQQLATVRQLEHRADGSLCWYEIDETAPRRAGKSERLRASALWRMEFGHDLFEPDQVVVHVGRDLPVVREIQQRVWRWCVARWGKESVTRANGKEQIEHPNGARWLAKAQGAGYGYDVHLGIVDECWDVDPIAIDEGIEPATLDRVSAQLVLTSTSHSRATSLMKGRLAGPLATDDGKTLLLYWGMEPGADIFAVATWKAASPHWNDERRAFIASKLEKAQATEPTPENPDPVGSWANQYLNRWDLVVRKLVKGTPLTTAEAWAQVVDVLPDRTPDAAAIETWFAAGASLALAWRLPDGAAVVRVVEAPDLAAAAEIARGQGVTTVSVGKSLADDPALKGLNPTPATGTAISAVTELTRLLTDGAVAHDGSEHLTGQVLAVRTTEGTDGPRLSSQHRTDAIKAAARAATAARRAVRRKVRARRITL